VLAPEQDEPDGEGAEGAVAPACGTGQALRPGSIPTAGGDQGDPRGGEQVDEIWHAEALHFRLPDAGTGYVVTIPVHGAFGAVHRGRALEADSARSSTASTDELRLRPAVQAAGWYRAREDNAKVHRIALVTADEGRYTFHTRSERGARR
jgi:hypothetical protein